MRTIIFASIIGLAAFQSHAIPTFTVNFSQWDSGMRLDAYSFNDGSPIGGAMYWINDTFAFGGNGEASSAIGFHHTYTIGINSIYAVFPELSEFTTSPQYFEILPFDSTELGPKQRVGGVPDGGATIALLGISLTCLGWLHRKISRSPSNS